MRIGMVSVFVSNPNEAFKFYTEVLGFEKKLHMPEAWIAIVVSKEDPNGTSLLLEPNHNQIAKTYQTALYKAGLPCIVFMSNDIQKDYEELKSHGIVFKKPPTKTEYGIEAIFDDTFGNFIQLHQI